MAAQCNCNMSSVGMLEDMIMELGRHSIAQARDEYPSVGAIEQLEAFISELDRKVGHINLSNISHGAETKDNGNDEKKDDGKGKKWFQA